MLIHHLLVIPFNIDQSVQSLFLSHFHQFVKWSKSSRLDFIFRSVLTTQIWVRTWTPQACVNLLNFSVIQPWSFTQIYGYLCSVLMTHLTKLACYSAKFEFKEANFFFFPHMSSRSMLIRSPVIFANTEKLFACLTSHIDLLFITKTIQVRRAKHAGHSWRSRDELICDVLLWTSHILPSKSRTTSSNIHTAAMWGYGM